MISAGAKEVITAWKLSWRHGRTGDWDLHHQWLSTRAPPKRGLRPKANPQGASSYVNSSLCMHSLTDGHV